MESNPSTTDCRNTLIYVLDDDESVRRSFVRLLRASGFTTVKPFRSALAFLSSAPVTKKAILLLDIHMPGMSGIELVNHMTESGLDIPTILITAHDVKPSLEWRASAPSVLDYLQKPVRESELIRLIEKGISLQATKKKTIDP